MSDIETTIKDKKDEYEGETISDEIKQLQRLPPEEKREIWGDTIAGLEWATPTFYVPPPPNSLSRKEKSNQSLSPILPFSEQMSYTPFTPSKSMLDEYERLKAKDERKRAKHREYMREYMRKRAARLRGLERTSISTTEIDVPSGPSFGHEVQSVADTATDTASVADTVSTVTTTTNPAETLSTSQTDLFINSVMEQLDMLNDKVDELLRYVEGNTMQIELEGSRITLQSGISDEKVEFLASTEQQYRSLIEQFAIKNCQLMDQINGNNSNSTVRIESLRE